MNKIITLIGFIIFSACSSSKGVYMNKKEIDLRAITGTWQIKDQQKFEKWALISPTESIGVLYDMTTGIASIDENLRLFKMDDTWIFEVKNKEHEFKPIQFSWKPDPAFRMRFVNEKNEYPQVIRYKINSDSTMVAETTDLKGANLVKYDYVKVVKK